MAVGQRVTVRRVDHARALASALSVGVQRHDVHHGRADAVERLHHARGIGIELTGIVEWHGMCPFCTLNRQGRAMGRPGRTAGWEEKTSPALRAGLSREADRRAAERRVRGPQSPPIFAPATRRSAGARGTLTLDASRLALIRFAAQPRRRRERFFCPATRSSGRYRAGRPVGSVPAEHQRRRRARHDRPSRTSLDQPRRPGRRGGPVRRRHRHRPSPRQRHAVAAGRGGNLGPGVARPGRVQPPPGGHAIHRATRRPRPRHQRCPAAAGTADRGRAAARRRRAAARRCAGPAGRRRRHRRADRAPRHGARHRTRVAQPGRGKNRRAGPPGRAARGR